MAKDIPDSIFNNLTHVFAGSDAFMAPNFLKIKVMELPHVEKKVVIVPVPDLPGFAENLHLVGVSPTHGDLFMAQEKKRLN